MASSGSGAGRPSPPDGSANGSMRGRPPAVRPTSDAGARRSHSPSPPHSPCIASPRPVQGDASPGAAAGASRGETLETIELRAALSLMLGVSAPPAPRAGGGGGGSGGGVADVTAGPAGGTGSPTGKAQAPSAPAHSPDGLGTLGSGGRVGSCDSLLDCAASVSDADTSSSSGDDDGCLDAFLAPCAGGGADGYAEGEGSDVSSLAGSQVLIV